VTHPTTLKPAPAVFSIDQKRLSELFGPDEENAACRLDRYGETPSEAIEGIVRVAQEAQGLVAPETVELHTLCPSPVSVVIAIRETNLEHQQHRAVAGFPAQRQVASWRMDAAQLRDGHGETFAELVGTLQNVCTEANALFPALAALIDGEKRVLYVIAKPIRVLTYDSRGRRGIYSAAVDDLTDNAVDLGRAVWPLLIETLETGEATEDWDGDRQRALQLRYGATPHLARQLLDLRRRLAEHGVGDLPQADPSLDTYLSCPTAAGT